MRDLQAEGKNQLIRKTKDASENGDDWDKILEET